KNTTNTLLDPQRTDRHRGRLRNRGNPPPTGGPTVLVPRTTVFVPVPHGGTTEETTYNAVMRQGCAETDCFSVLIASSCRAYAKTTKSGNEQDFTNNDYPSTSASYRLHPSEKSGRYQCFPRPKGPSGLGTKTLNSPIATLSVKRVSSLRIAIYVIGRIGRNVACYF